MIEQRSRFAALLAAPLVVALLVTGCGNVSLEGGLFDAMGVSDKKLAAAQREKKLKPRTGLVMPPSNKRLPEPGSANPNAGLSDPSFPVDPETRRERDKQQKLAAHNAYCEKKVREAKTFRRPTSGIQGPMGSCDPGLLEKWTGKNLGDNINR